MIRRAEGWHLRALDREIDKGFGGDTPAADWGSPAQSAVHEASPASAGWTQRKTNGAGEFVRWPRPSEWWAQHYDQLGTDGATCGASRPRCLLLHSTLMNAARAAAPSLDSCMSRVSRPRPAQPAHCEIPPWKVLGIARMAFFRRELEQIGWRPCSLGFRCPTVTFQKRTTDPAASDLVPAVANGHGSRWMPQAVGQQQAQRQAGLAGCGV